MSVAVVSRDAFERVLAGAGRIGLSAYALSEHCSVTRALEAAADRGARVAVVLEGAPYEPRAGGGGSLAARNARTATDLRAHGVDVRLARADEPRVHLKAAVVDGTAYLDDRNWPDDDAQTILATSDAADVAAVSSALAGVPAGDARLATDKDSALMLEARTIRSAPGDRIDVESESFGFSPVSRALFERASAGAHVRLLVAEREFAAAGSQERKALARLAAAGVEVKVGSDDEKLCVAGDRAWSGSANATFAFERPPALDWGMTLSQPDVVTRLEGAFERHWQAARSPLWGRS